MKNQWGLQGQKPYESEEIDVGIDVPSHFKVLQLKWTEIISTSLTDLKMDMNIICLNIFVTSRTLKVLVVWVLFTSPTLYLEHSCPRYHLTLCLTFTSLSWCCLLREHFPDYTKVAHPSLSLCNSSFFFAHNSSLADVISCLLFWLFLVQITSKLWETDLFLFDPLPSRRVGREPNA